MRRRVDLHHQEPDHENRDDIRRKWVSLPLLFISRRARARPSRVVAKRCQSEPRSMTADLASCHGDWSCQLLSRLGSVSPRRRSVVAQGVESDRHADHLLRIPLFTLPPVPFHSGDMLTADKLKIIACKNGNADPEAASSSRK